ncbi:hypothetical protein B0H13DRAFT_2304039 [Mycena leptocephala]|nr:hypothetical protein B0H13DRAFT_2304039 [Mycena leptocephala]
MSSKPFRRGFLLGKSRANDPDTKSPVWAKTELAVRQIINGGHDVLSAAEPFIQLVPVPGIAPAIGCLLKMWEEVQKVTDNQEQCLQLVERAARILKAIIDRVLATGPVPLTEITTANIETLNRGLLEVQLFMTETKPGWTSRFLRKSDIAASIQDCNSKLADCAMEFNILCHIDIADWLSTMSQEQQTQKQLLLDVSHQLQNGMQETSSTVQPASGPMEGLLDPATRRFIAFATRQLSQSSFSCMTCVSACPHPLQCTHEFRVKNLVRKSTEIGISGATNIFRISVDPSHYTVNWTLECWGSVHYHSSPFIGKISYAPTMDRPPRLKFETPIFHPAVANWEGLSTILGWSISNWSEILTSIAHAIVDPDSYGHGSESYGFDDYNNQAIALLREEPSSFRQFVAWHTQTRLLELGSEDIGGGWP